jgi:hypothetical protein
MSLVVRCGDLAAERKKAKRFRAGFSHYRHCSYNQ